MFDKGTFFFHDLFIHRNIFIGIGDVILHTVQLNRCDPALAVVGVAYHVVAALNFDSTAVGIGGIVGIFLAVLTKR